MELSRAEQAMLDGAQGPAVRKAMQILTTLGEIYGAERMTAVSSVQVAGVSYDNLGEPGLQFLEEMAEGGGRARVLTTLNPAGMDVENWKSLGIDAEFARNQERVIAAFVKMNVIPSCTCTPYLVGNLPSYGQHIAWAESSAVCYANSVLGARTNREGGPSALAASLTGMTPVYGYHLDAERYPDSRVMVEAHLHGTRDFGALGKVLGERMQADGTRVPYILGIGGATVEELKAFCASLATFGGAALFHMEGITPEAQKYKNDEKADKISQKEIAAAVENLRDHDDEEVDFVSLGCPHLTIDEIARIAELLEGKKVQKEFWITTARVTKQKADELGFTRIIEESGAKFAADTCCVVAPIRNRFRVLATDSAKACYYASSKNRFRTRFGTFEEIVMEALLTQESV